MPFLFQKSETPNDHLCDELTIDKRQALCESIIPHLYSDYQKQDYILNKAIKYCETENIAAETCYWCSNEVKPKLFLCYFESEKDGPEYDYWFFISNVYRKLKPEENAYNWYLVYREDDMGNVCLVGKIKKMKDESSETNV